MTEVAGFPVRTSWWRRVLRSRDRGPRVDFAELCFIHHHWRAALAAGAPGAELERRYRDALDRFQAEHGLIVNAYWCSGEASGAVLTLRRRKLAARVTRRPARFRFHRLTDWATKNRADAAELLHQCDELAVKATEILRGTTQRITMELIMSSAAHVLGLADEASRHDRPSDLRRALAGARRSLAQTRGYYEEVALREAQIVYFWGMVAGLVAVALVASGGVTVFVQGDADQELAYVTVLAGAVGAIVSVLMRVTKNTFVVDADLGRGSLRRLGSFRPVIGAVSGLAVYLAYRSGVLTIQPVVVDEHAPQYFYSLLAFLAGFSERFAKDVLDAAADTVGTAAGRRASDMPDEEPPDEAPRAVTPA